MSVFKNVKKNAGYLYIFQGVSYIMPIILIPFLIEYIGASEYGKYAYAMAYISIFRTVVSYGFDMSATKTVSENRKNCSLLVNTYTSVVATKITLLILCFIAVSVVSLVSGTVREIAVVLNILFILLLGEIFFPSWFFLGMEDMRSITIIRTASKVLFVFLVFIFISNNFSVIDLALLESISVCVFSIVANLYAYKKYRIRIGLINFTCVLKELKFGFELFVAQFTVHLYSTINTIILGFFVDTSVIAYFSITEKIYSAFRGLLNPIAQSLYPPLASLYSKDRSRFKKSAKSIVNKFGVFVIVLFLAMMLSVYFTAPLLYRSSVDSIYWMNFVFSLSLLFSFGSIITPLLVIANRRREVLKLAVLGVVVNSMIIYPLCSLYSGIGAAIAFLITQQAQFIFQIKYYKNWIL